MKTIAIVFFFFITAFSTAQEINPVLYEKTWLNNETRYINGFAITKVFGQMPHAPSAYNFLPVTSVSFKDLTQLKDELTKTAETEKWSNKNRDRQLMQLEQNARGGEIEIYITRYDEEYANFKWFFVILRGMDDKRKLWEKELGYQAPEMPYEKGWWNYKKVQIPVELKPPFYIYLNDKSSRYLSDFKFRVESASNQPADN